MCSNWLNTRFALARLAQGLERARTAQGGLPLFALRTVSSSAVNPSVASAASKSNAGKPLGHVHVSGKLDKWALVNFGDKYKTADDVPSTVHVSELETAITKFRIAIMTILMLTISGAGFYIALNKPTAAERIHGPGIHTSPVIPSKTKQD